MFLFPANPVLNGDPASGVDRPVASGRQGPAEATGRFLAILVELRADGRDADDTELAKPDLQEVVDHPGPALTSDIGEDGDGGSIGPPVAVSDTDASAATAHRPEPEVRGPMAPADRDGTAGIGRASAGPRESAAGAVPRGASLRLPLSPVRPDAQSSSARLPDGMSDGSTPQILPSDMPTAQPGLRNGTSRPQEPASAEAQRLKNTVDMRVGLRDGELPGGGRRPAGMAGGQSDEAMPSQGLRGLAAAQDSPAARPPLAPANIGPVASRGGSRRGDAIQEITAQPALPNGRSQGTQFEPMALAATPSARPAANRPADLDMPAGVGITIRPATAQTEQTNRSGLQLAGRHANTEQSADPALHRSAAGAPATVGQRATGVGAPDAPRPANALAQTPDDHAPAPIADAGEDVGQRASAEGGPTARTVQPGTASPAPHMPRAAVHQIAAAIQGSADRSFDITLSPAELGKVRITLTPGEAGVSVSIVADRPETLDLLRRHVDHLAQDFRDIGYESARFSFGSGGREGATASLLGQQAEADDTAEPVTGAAPADPQSQVPEPEGHGDGRMDIRI